MKGKSVAYLLTVGICLAALAGCGGERPPQEHRHEISYVAELEPTCTEDGRAGHWECLLCGACFSDEAGEHPCQAEVLPAAGHALIIEEEPASCEEDGLKRIKCLYCSFEETEVIPAPGHLWGSWSVTLSPTCCQEGEKTRVCGVCGRTEKDSLPVKEHEFGEWALVQPPSCGQAGEEARSCALCGSRETRPLAALEHVYGTDNVCTLCGSACAATPGLAYTPVTGRDGNFAGYAVSLGSAQAEEIVVAPYHEGAPVVAVAEGGFTGYRTMEQFICHAAVEEVGAEAFRGCTSLLAIELPDSVLRVGERAFYGCSKVKSLSVGSGLQEIGESAFYSLQKLGHIAVSEENTAFSGAGECLIERETGKLLLGCAASVIPQEVREIGDNAFYNLEGLAAVEVPAGVTCIGHAAFLGCRDLASFTFLGSEAAWEAVEKGDRWCAYTPFGEVSFGV